MDFRDGVMDKKELYEKAEKAFNQAFEAAKHSVKVVSEKAGEAAHVTKLLIDKAAVEHRMAKVFSALGHRVYECSRNNESIAGGDGEAGRLIEEIRKLEGQVSDLNAALEKERAREKKDAETEA